MFRLQMADEDVPVMKFISTAARKTDPVLRGFVLFFHVIHPGFARKVEIPRIWAIVDYTGVWEYVPHQMLSLSLFVSQVLETPSSAVECGSTNLHLFPSEKYVGSALQQQGHLKIF